MGPYGIKISYSLTNPTSVVPSYRLRIDVAQAVNITDKVFVYRKTTLGNDVFEGVASPDQILTVPPDLPDPESTYPTKFRLNYVEQANAQADILLDALEEIQTAITRLTDSLTAADALSSTSIVWLGILGSAHSTSSILSAS